MIEKYPDFWSVMLGPVPGYFFAYLVWAFICALGIVLISLKRRDRASNPDKLSLRYWIADNTPRVVGHLLILPVFIRIEYEYVEGLWMLLLAAGTGFGIDQLGKIAKKYGILTTSKAADSIAEELNNKAKFK